MHGSHIIWTFNLIQQAFKLKMITFFQREFLWKQILFFSSTYIFVVLGNGYFLRFLDTVAQLLHLQESFFRIMYFKLPNFCTSAEFLVVVIYLNSALELYCFQVQFNQNGTSNVCKKSKMRNKRHFLCWTMIWKDKATWKTDLFCQIRNISTKKNIYLYIWL